MNNSLFYPMGFCLNIYSDAYTKKAEFAFPISTYFQTFINKSKNLVNAFYSFIPSKLNIEWALILFPYRFYKIV